MPKTFGTPCIVALLYRIATKQIIFLRIPYNRATQLILTEVHLDNFSTSRGPVKFLIYNDKNETLITSKYKKIIGFSLSLHTLLQSSKSKINELSAVYSANFVKKSAFLIFSQF